MWEKIMEYQTNYSSPLGKICLTSDGEYLTGLWFADSSDSKKHLQKHPFKDLDIFKQTSNWLDIYFSGKNPNFEIKFRFENISPFQKEVYDILLKVKYGQVVTYNDIAKTIAKNRGIKRMSAQAVGGALNANPICIIVPCHRVISANGNLTGYGGGINNKISLLKLEHIDTSKLYYKD